MAHFTKSARKLRKPINQNQKNRNSAHHGQTYEHNYNYDAALGFEGK